MEEKNVTLYDKTEVVENQIAAHIAEIKRICAFENIPFLIAIAEKSDKNDTKYYYESNCPGSSSIKLANDKFGKFLRIITGADDLLEKRGAAAVEEYMAQNIPDDEDGADIIDTGNTTPASKPEMILI